MYGAQAVIVGCGMLGPSKKPFCSGVSSPDGGTFCAGLPKKLPGASRFVRPAPAGGALIESTEVGSCPPMKGDTHSGGKMSGGGLGQGAQHARFSAPVPMMPLICPVNTGCIVLPLMPGLMIFLPSNAHRLPPLAWQPNGAGPLLNVRSSA